MVCPTILVRVKQPDFAARFGIHGSDSMSFVAVARRATETEIRKDGFSACRAGHDVLDLEYRDRQVLRRPTVCAAAAEVLGDAFPQISRYVGTHARGAPVCWRSVYLARVFNKVS